MRLSFLAGLAAVSLVTSITQARAQTFSLNQEAYQATYQGVKANYVAQPGDVAALAQSDIDPARLTAGDQALFSDRNGAVTYKAVGRLDESGTTPERAFSLGATSPDDNYHRVFVMGPMVMILKGHYRIVGKALCRDWRSAELILTPNTLSTQDLSGFASAMQGAAQANLDAGVVCEAYTAQGEDDYLAVGLNEQGGYLAANNGPNAREHLVPVKPLSELIKLVREAVAASGQ
ncbi:hypothetical protein ABAC460_14570 [Asticcacaulis sp. AC460]|uniref:hypothetical protein n=1 Tax=Asticcacaulis sp. AC460 TaxID=1282360 RepID=UPI0003C400EC|nr:hypothetical protein [Asticcacaulis sp. AC460]ESQ89001.1 hypothetical protein ABAC460_14570 [Asticcacaulis sp. AC460]